MGLDGQRARQRWVGLGTVCKFLHPALILVCIFLNPAAKVLINTGCRNLHFCLALCPSSPCMPIPIIGGGIGGPGGPWPPHSSQRGGGKNVFSPPPPIC